MSAALVLPVVDRGVLNRVAPPNSAGRALPPPVRREVAALEVLEGPYLEALRGWRVTEKGPLGRKQSLFAALQPLVILHARLRLRRELRLFEFQRDERTARWNSEHCRKCKQHKGHAVHRPATKGFHKFRSIGILRSLHRIRLAGDYGLFDAAGAYLTKSEQYLALGEYWEELHPLACWGGRFQDGNHLSLRHQGRK